MRSAGSGKVWDRTSLLAAGILLVAGMVLNLGYLKDDAFISYRYARNLVDGNGMVFNTGERVEGYTNFLWILLHAPVIGLGRDPVAWSRVLGAASSIGTLLLVWRMARWLNDGRPSIASLAAPWILASSTSVAVWSTSGMAPCLVMLLGTAAVFALWKALREDHLRHWIGAGFAMAGAALTRPEGHLFFLVGAAAVLVHSAAARRPPPRGAWWMVAVVGALLVPYHVWRFLYFGDLLPLTFYAKGSGGPEVWGTGLRQVVGLLVFNLNVLVAVPGLASLVPRRDRGYRAVPVVLWMLFLTYMVKIGADEMTHYRLFLPAYGLFVVSGAEGLRELCQGWSQPRYVIFARAAAIAAVVAIVGSSLRLTVSSREFHSNYRAAMEQSSMEMGRYMLERSASEDTAIFQDLGACSWSAYPLRFVDPIGVLNPFVARELAADRINPFLREVTASRPGGPATLREFDRKVREHLFDVDARWVGFVAYVDDVRGMDAGEFRERLNAALEARDAALAERLLAPLLRVTPHAHGMYEDARFARRYRMVGVWRRSRAAYLALFERRLPSLPRR